jgi:cytochrome P450
MSKHLRYTEVIANAVLFMLAGFETTSNFLAYSTYALAKHPDIQERLRLEIDQQWKESEELDYEQVAEMTYMDMFIREVLRMYRVSGQSSSRQCNSATTVCGHQIDEGNVDLHTVR